MKDEIAAWKKSGEFIQVTPFRLNMFVKQMGSPRASPERTLLLVHGFPESSFSYHKVVNGLLECGCFDRIVLCDFIGFGFSDKPPAEIYAYSLFEHADVLLAAWKHFGVTGGHVLCHDMGTSIVTEILARHEAGILPDGWFSAGLQSLTFTNGSMVLKYAQLRITQRLLISSIGHLFSRLAARWMFDPQIRSAHGNTETLSQEDIDCLWELASLQDGIRKTHLTNKYYHDRTRFESVRWLPALKQTTLPVHLCWGFDDAVAPPSIPKHLKDYIVPKATLTYMNGAGHFCQLGSPELWIESVTAFYKKLASKN